MELSPQSLESWQATFSTLQKAASESEDGVDPTMAALVMESTKTAVDFTMTPGRKRQAVVVETVSEEDEDVTTVRTPKMKRQEMPWNEVPLDIGNSQPTPTVKVLQTGAWSSLVENVNLLRENHDREVSDWREAEVTLEEQLEKMQVKVSVLHERLGKRPEQFGTRSAFQLLEVIMTTVSALEQMVLERTTDSKPPTNVEDRMNKLDSQVEELSSCLKSLVRAALNGFLGDDLTEFCRQFVNPTLTLLSKSSASNANPGGKWEQLLEKLQDRMKSLEKKVLRTSVDSTSRAGTNTGGSMGSMFSWLSVGPDVDSQAANRSGSSSGVGVRFEDSVADGARNDISMLKEELRQMRAELHDLQEQADSHSITIGSLVFPSRAHCVTWLALHNATADPHVFVDAISLLSLATSDSSPDEEKAANQRATTAKVRDKTPYHIAYIASFDLEVPPLLGKGSDQSMTTNSRALGGVPKFEDFHPPSGREGIHQRILDHAKDGSLTIQQAVGELFAFGTEPSSVAKELLLLSKTFWDELCHWMVRYHAQVQAESEASEQEVWILISHCVRAVFKSLREARAPGRASNTPGGMLWGTLKAHEVMKEYRLADFSGHPKIALILHEHLIRFATPRSKFDWLQASINERLDKMQRSINQAVSSANKAGKKA